MIGVQGDSTTPGGLRKQEELGYEKRIQTPTECVSQSIPSLDDSLQTLTIDEQNSLRRVADKVPWDAYLIAVVELAERFSYYGTTVVFTNFIQQRLPSQSRTGAGFADGQSGALGMGQRASTGIGTFNSFWTNVTPLFGAYIADTRWGRFKTIYVAVIITIFGHILLVISSVPGVIDHQRGAFTLFIIAIIFMGLGSGSFKSNVCTLVAEQYKRTKPSVITTGSGERVIVDPILTTSRIYMYFYEFINIGSLMGQISMTYAEKYVGFYLAYTLPTSVFLLCPFVLYIGRNRYVSSPPCRSVLTKAVSIWRFSMRGRWSWNPHTMYKRISEPEFWDSSKPSSFKGEARPAWMTFDDQWVDEIKRGFKACEVYLWYPVYFLTYDQLNNNLTSQAATMVTHGVPNDVLSNLNPFTLIVFIPVCDLFIYPALRRAGISFTPIKKITVGFFIGAAAMAWAAVVQHYIYQHNPCGYHVSTCVDADGRSITSTLTVWSQTGSYVLIAFSEILVVITGLEYAFTKAPKNMRSFVMGICLFTIAIANAIGEAFVSLSADPLLVWNYTVMGILATIAGTLFWYRHRHLDTQEDELNNLAEGHFDSDSDCK
ncbi:hypothetical protein AcV5_002778 [Taiwanofungus camphoratus]|nr:hypothetical protein AcV5_002778 [Antrodia cinnamomea]